MWSEYTWVFALSFFVAFVCAFGIGANDVGAKALKIWQAVIIAGICEFLGAVLLGASVTDTIRSNIAKASAFQETPELLLFGFFCVMLTAAFWDNFACHLELPVSTTHTTIGAIVGMTVVLRGFGAVVWSEHQATFPYIKGMVVIFLSWVVSPICSGIVVVLLYGVILRPFVLRSQHSFQRAFYIVPVLVGATFFVVTLFIIQTGNKNKTWTPSVADTKAVWISIIPAVVLAAITLFGIMPFLRRSIEHESETDIRALEDGQHTKKELVDTDGKPIEVMTSGPGESDVQKSVLADIDAANSTDATGCLGRWWEGTSKNRVVKRLTNNVVIRKITYGSRYDVHEIVQEGHADFDQRTANVWAHAEQFDPKTEKLFRYLQVFSACVMSFSHGANDVSNSVGPFSAVYNIWSNGAIEAKSSVPTWILVLGGAGIVCGLATYGYKIMRVIGVKTVKLSNSRGFCAELSTAIVVMVASRYGLPVSTTQVIMGAVFAVGMMEGVRGVNWRTIARTVCGWVATLIVAALLCAAITAFTEYAPQKQAADAIYAYSINFGDATVAMIQQLNGTGGINDPSLLLTLNTSVNTSFFNTPRDTYNQIALFQDTLNLYNVTFA